MCRVEMCTKRVQKVLNGMEFGVWRMDWIEDISKNNRVTNNKCIKIIKPLVLM